MKFKRFLSVALCTACAVTCFAGCHKKNELAAKVGDQKFTSGYYACALVYADTEARTKVDKQLTDAGKSTTDVDYLKKKIDGKKYETWVKDKAEENIKINAAYKAKCKEKKFELDEEQKSAAKSSAELYWTSYGYEQVFSVNGVSKETFLKYTEDTYYEQVYFNKVYGAEGETPVTDEQIKEALSSHYVLADVLTAALDGTDEEKETTRSQFKTYKGVLDDKTSTFDEVYKSHNASEDGTEDGTEDVTAEETADDGTPKPQDSNAQLFGDKFTDNESSEFEEISKMEIGEVKIVEKDDTITLYVRLDPLADPYYQTENEDSLRKVAVGIDTLKKEMVDYADKLGVEFIKDAIDVFKVKNIEYPEQES